MGFYNSISELDLPWELMREKTILITGGNGMIASALIEALVEVSETRDLQIHIYVLCRNRINAEKRFANYLKNNNFHLVIQDVVEPLNCTITFDFIIHAASSANPNAFNEFPVEVMKANFIGTLNLLEYAKKCGHTRFMYVSSSEVYGENEDGISLFTEEMPGKINFTRFRACYPESKRASETLSFCYQKEYGVNIVIVRPAFIYGKDIIDSNTRADVYFLRQALKHEDIVMFSSGEQIRSYCYVKDCISGMLFALLKGENGGIYNIGDKNCEITLMEYAKMLAKAGGVKVCVKVETAPQEKVFLKTTKLILDTERLEKLGWTPRYTLKEGIADIFGSKKQFF